jgi:S-adenosyl-L-methionine hydrolase (adenosine-forming)
LANQNRLVTFTTDFGTADHYVGTMKGVVLGINPEARIADISNSVQSFDILDGALTIAAAYSYFPSGTVHMVIVDPGVGSSRRPILVRTSKHYFIAPDNGVLSLVYEREQSVAAWHITAEHYFLQPVSQTFHGRDIFSAVAGHMSKGVDVEKFGDEITDFVRFAAPRPKQNGAAEMKGVIIKVDKFGNLITNFRPADVPQLFAGVSAPLRMRVGKTEVNGLKPSYSEGAPGEVFAIVGSSDFIEVAMNRGSAARACGADKGAEVTLAIPAAAAQKR